MDSLKLYQESTNHLIFQNIKTEIFNCNSILRTSHGLGMEIYRKQMHTNFSWKTSWYGTTPETIIILKWIIRIYWTSWTSGKCELIRTTNTQSETYLLTYFRPYQHKVKEFCPQFSADVHNMLIHICVYCLWKYE